MIICFLQISTCLLTAPCSLLPAPCSLLYTLLPTPCSLLPTLYSHSLLSIPSFLLPLLPDTHALAKTGSCSTCNRASGVRVIEPDSYYTTRNHVSPVVITLSLHPYRVSRTQATRLRCRLLHSALPACVRFSLHLSTSACSVPPTKVHRSRTSLR